MCYHGLVPPPRPIPQRTLTCTAQGLAHCLCVPAWTAGVPQQRDPAAPEATLPQHPFAPRGLQWLGLHTAPFFGCTQLPSPPTKPPFNQTHPWPGSTYFAVSSQLSLPWGALLSSLPLLTRARAILYHFTRRGHQDRALHAARPWVCLLPAASHSQHRKAEGSPGPKEQ